MSVLYGGDIMVKTADKAETKPAKVKKGRGKKALKVIGIIILVIAIAIGACAAISAAGSNSNLKLAKSFDKVEYTEQLVPVQDDEGDWVFTLDRELKIVQLTDVHLGGGFMSITKDANALKAVAAMLTAEKPDLVIVTGDVAYPIPFQAGTLNNQTGAKLFANLMDTLGIYWTVCFGNHDTEPYSYYDREEISEFYMQPEFEYCIFEKGPADIDGFGNQVIKVENSKGVITQALFVIDSHDYATDRLINIMSNYDNIHQNQVDWYAQRVKALNEANAAKGEKGTVKSMLFFHIPLPEYRDAWNEFAANGFKDTENVKYVRGMLGETGDCIYCGEGEDEMFETALELGSTQAVFCGHDHFNNFTVNYKGIDLNYAYSVDYLAYIGIKKKGSQRGCTVITVNPDGSYASEDYNLYESGRYELPEELTKGVKMQFADVEYQYFKD